MSVLKAAFETKKKSKAGKPILVFAPVEDSGNSTVGTITCTPALAGAAFNSAASVSRFKLDKSYFTDIVRSGILRFSLGESGGNSFVPAPVPYWFERIELWSLGGEGKIQEMHADQLYASLGHLTEEQTKIWGDLVGYDPKSFGTTSLSVPANSTGVYFYLPLIMLMTNHARINPHKLKDDLELRFYPKSEGIVSSGSGTPNLLEVVLRVDYLELDKKNLSYTEGLSTKAVLNHKYVDVMKYSFPAQTYSASTAYQMALDQFDCRGVMLMFALRASTSNASGAALKFVDLCDSAIDLKLASGTSFFGNGNPVLANYLKKAVGHRVFSSPNFSKYNSLYALPFCHDPDETITEFQFSGYHEFKKDRQLLCITTAAAPTFYTQTITQDAAATAGSILLGYDGEFTRVAYNASTSALATAVNALTTMQRDRMSVSFSATLAAGAATVVTFKQLDGSFVQPKKLLQYVPCANLTGATYATTTVSQFGTAGYVAGSYILDVWVYYIKNLYIDNGKLTTSTYGRISG